MYEKYVTSRVFLCTVMTVCTSHIKEVVGAKYCFNSPSIRICFHGRLLCQSFLQRKKLFYGIQLTFLSFFYNFAADSELCAAGVVYGYGEAAGARIPAQNQVMI